MDMLEIKNRLVKKATGLSTGGFKPTYSDKESWIGRIAYYREDESIPEDAAGLPMLPILQLSLEGLPYVPEGLENIRMITLFVSEDLPSGIAEEGADWVLREYTKTDDLVEKDLGNSETFLRSFPLKTTYIPEDYPVWDGDSIPEDLVEEIIRLEKKGEIDDYYNEVINNYGHKLGGYPTFYRPDFNFDDGYEFKLQIASDEKARLNIIEEGTIFLAKHKENGSWQLFVDFP
ncbi:MAG: DUF1963 domain-containing protein [Bacteroidetes bacterium]|nr:DUF1963 domain-containing protein [Bacteroidota bacterium]